MIDLIFSYELLQLIWEGAFCLLMLFSFVTYELAPDINALKKTKIADQVVC